MTADMTLPAPPRFRGSFHTDLPTRSAYSEGAGPYRIVPSAVAIPEGAEDLAALVRYTGEHGVSLVPRGAGSGMPGGNVGSGIVVDLQRFDRPLFVSDRKTANVGAAVTAAELHAAAAHLKLRLPPDPSSADFCTIAGMVATNAAGARSLRFGSMRRWVRGVEVVTADGEVGWIGRAGSSRSARRPTDRQRRDLKPQLSAITRFNAEAMPDIQRHADTIVERFPPTTKNSAGYALDEFLRSEDVLDLLIGSEGTLCFVTRIEVQLDLQPEAQSTVLLALQDAAALSDVVAALLPLEPTSVEFLDRTYLRLARPTDDKLDAVDGMLLVEFERPNEAAARGVVGDAVRATRPWCAYVETALTESERGDIWRIRREASSALARLPATRRPLQIIEDGCVPVASLADYLTGVRRAADEAGIEIVAFGHAGDGHLHINALVDSTAADLEPRLTHLLDATTDLTVSLNGTPSGEHGDGRMRGPLLERFYGTQVMALFRAVKRAFDPRNVMNRGIVIPGEAAKPISDLKVGPDAAAIPERIARQLLEMERGGGWGRAKETLAAADDTGVTGRQE